MPAITEANLKLVRLEDGNIDVNVSYKVVFSPLERHLAGLGLIFLERILVYGMDDPERNLLTVIIPLEVLEVTDGNVQQEIKRQRTNTVARAWLDEDGSPIALPDAIPDEIRCKIRIERSDFPPARTEAFTNEAVLGFFQPSPIIEATAEVESLG